MLINDKSPTINGAFVDKKQYGGSAFKVFILCFVQN
jgi:hypothetical protein